MVSERIEITRPDSQTISRSATGQDSATSATSAAEVVPSVTR